MFTFTHLFIEGKSIEGKSAKSIRFYEMLALAEQGKWEVILFPSLARLAPHKSQLLPLLNALNALPLEVHFLQEQMVLSSPVGQRLLTILTTLSDGERERARKQITKSIRERFQQGESWLNTTRFLGYVLNKHGELEIQPQEAVIVRQSGFSLQQTPFLLRRMLSITRCKQEVKLL